MDVFEFIVSVVAMVLVAVTFWILILRKDKKHQNHGDPQSDYQLSELSAMADSMKERIDILESILDAEVPDWREQNEHGAK